MNINFKSWLALSLLLVSSTCPNAVSAETAGSVAINNIYLNQNKQLVVEFDNPAHINPIAPQVLDYPGEKHDIVLEFSNTSFAVGKVPRAKAVLDELTKVFPNVSSIAYAASNDATRARIRLSVSKDITIHPGLAKIDKDSAIINLDLPPKISTNISTNTDTNTDTNANSEADKGQQASAKEQTTTGNIAAATPTATTPDQNTAATAQASTTASPNVAAAAQALTTASPNIATTAQALTTTGNTAAIAPVTPPAGIKTKAIQSLKGTWHSGISKLFGAKKQSGAQAQASAEQEQPSPVASTVGVDTTSSATLSASETQIAATPSTASNNTTNLAANSVPAAGITDETSKSIATNLNQPQTAIVPDNTSSLPSVATGPVDAGSVNLAPTNAAPPSVAAVPVDNTGSASLAPTNGAPPVASTAGTSIIPSIIPLKTEINPAPAIAATQPKIGFADKPGIAATQPEIGFADKQGEESTTSTDKNKDEILNLPRIPAQSQDTTSAVNNINDLVTPLKADEPKADLASAVVPSNIQALLTKGEAVADSSIAKGNTAESLQAAPKVQLKSMKAHSGGKDYFPPQMAGGQEVAYNPETLQHYNEAVRLHLAGKLTEAIAEYKAAIEENPRIEEAHSNLGLIFNQQNKYDQAMAEFHKALAINPKDAITYNGIGAAMRAQKNMLAAVKNWQTAISLDPHLASAHYNLGTAYEMDKDLEKALAEYKLAVKFDDNLGEAYYHMGLILQKMNNPNLALEQFKQAVKVSSQADYTQDAKHRVTLLSEKKGGVL